MLEIAPKLIPTEIATAPFWGSVMDCDELRDDQWERLKDLVPGGTKGRRGPRTDNRRFLNAFSWASSNSSPLPSG
jgi:hypothetical protein